VVFDPVGGAYTEAALRTLSWEGRHLVVGFAAGVPQIPLNLPLLKGCQICGVFWGSYIERGAARYATQLQELFRLYLTGAIRPRISARFPLAQAGEAIARLGQRRSVGKMVVTLEG
jgi:NADPH2:quinone reductase